MELKQIQHIECEKALRDRAREAILAEIELPQVGKVAEFRWDWTCEFVVGEEQPSQACEVAELGRNRTREAVHVEN